MDFVQYTVKAYNLPLLLVELILGTLFGPFRFAVIVILILFMAGLGVLFWLRRSRPPG